ncbi:hypothetical protein SUGI_1051280 [Cryptomeria japonica]|nr:hypothetical protein SUGI_1051280 [Cryptomeria japonica]
MFWHAEIGIADGCQSSKRENAHYPKWRQNRSADIAFALTDAENARLLRPGLMAITVSQEAAEQECSKGTVGNWGFIIFTWKLDVSIHSYTPLDVGIHSYTHGGAGKSYSSSTWHSVKCLRAFLCL